jgi:CubicO group peptidase (beta-lactamase class C family)
VWTNEGVAENGTRILNASTVTDALTLRYGASTFGFGWAQGTTADGARTVWGHSGALRGVCTRVNIDPVNRDGFVMLLNGLCSTVGSAMNAIENRAFRVLEEH